jgi:hypothetical protein
MGNLISKSKKPNSPGGKTVLFDLFLISFLGLFFEVLIIRWLSAEVRLLAYFKNLPLMSCFLGLGIGFALAKRKINFYAFFPIIFCLFSGLVLLGSRAQLLRIPYPGSSEEFIWSVGKSYQFISLIRFHGTIILIFLLNSLAFVPLGQLTGKLMSQFPPIMAYTVNILGSLLGTWAFSIVCFLCLPPLYWFGLALILSLWLLRKERLLVLLENAAFVGVLLVLLYTYQGDSLWSPYYKIDIQPIEGTTDSGDKIRWGYKLRVNQDYHQRAIDLSPDFIEKYRPLFGDVVEDASYAYDHPYSFKNPHIVLVVGAGAGNDVASALRHGAAEVNAVEIDPLIVEIGKRLHPEHPYQSSKVNIFIDDARSFFKKTEKQYDLIVFGLLDSHTLFSTMPSLRLDNFVYTIESFEETARLLSQDGIIVLTFSKGQMWLADRLYYMLARVFGKGPLFYFTGYDGGIMFVTGPGVINKGLLGDPQSPSYQVIPATDDWPYLYLRGRTIPATYWENLILVLILSAALILWVFPESKKVNFHFFFLGSAFLLIEFKSITELALLFGSTWLVNSIAISAILVMALAANLYVSSFRVRNMKLYYSLLLGSLLFNYLLPLDRLLRGGFLLKGVVSSLMLSLPLFFAGIIFSTSLKETEKIEIAFGSNLLGAVAGGLFEYVSLVFGIKSLHIFAGLMYVLSALALSRHGTSVKS